MSSPHHIPFLFIVLAFCAALGLTVSPALAIAQESTGQETQRERTRIEIERDRTGDDPGTSQVEEHRYQEAPEESAQQDVRVSVDTASPDDIDRPHWMFTVGRNAIWGGLVGGLLGVGVYMLTGFDASPWIIAQFSGGGILVGAATGVIEAFVAPDLYSLEAPNSVRWVQQEIPESFHLRVLEFDF